MPAVATLPGGGFDTLISRQLRYFVFESAAGRVQNTMGDDVQDSSALLCQFGRTQRPTGRRLERGTWIAWLLLSIPSLLATGCDSSPGSAVPTKSSSTVSASGQPSLSTAGRASEITDPLSEITDKGNPRYVDSAVKPLLHTRGIGASQFPLKADAGTRSVRVYVACAPTSSFKADVGKSFTGECSNKFQNFADIPVSPGELNLRMTIPGTTQFVVLVIPTP
jgi:hypothetical protein